MIDETARDLAELKEKYAKLNTAFELRADFIEWLFETEIDYATQSEMWDKFEKENPDDTSELLTIDKNT